MKILVQLIGLSRSTIYDRMNPKSPRYDSTFPLPVKLSGAICKGGAVAWVEEEIAGWIRARTMSPTSSGVANDNK
ncbi:helix-turn-helix transcriptional regulator [Pseudomonas sp. C9-3]|uniref:helix-turn-helix transcriptional regulator n=1 Tax=Pseudomonas sp. C9-3 TaxID=3078264 RepID=UPI0028F0A0EF|nr:AlpA family phage regulatory protein [Pseudomonas sp. C9-3]